jgi:hypothetical protein
MSNAKELLREMGIHFDKRSMLSIEDVKSYGDESFGDCMQTLEEFYNDKHNEILQVQLDLFYEYLNNRK